MKTERELFEEYLLRTDKFKFRNKTFLFMLDDSGEYEDQPVLEHWETWQASSSRDGFVLVPVEPTKDMQQAAFDVYEVCDYKNYHLNSGTEVRDMIYKVMIEAANEN